MPPFGSHCVDVLSVTFRNTECMCAHNTDKHHTVYLETCRAPFNKLNGFLLLNHGDGWVHILGYHITTVQHADCHVLPFSWITVHLPTHSNCKITQDTECSPLWSDSTLQSPLQLTQQLSLQSLNMKAEWQCRDISDQRSASAQRKTDLPHAPYLQLHHRPTSVTIAHVPSDSVVQSRTSWSLQQWVAHGLPSLLTTREHMWPVTHVSHFRMGNRLVKNRMLRDFIHFC